jgi:hypothetical protein
LLRKSNMLPPQTGTVCRDPAIPAGCVKALLTIALQGAPEFGNDAMRVNAAANAAVPAAAPRRAAASKFTLSEAQNPHSAAQSAAPRAVASLDALLALQGFDDPGERRRRAVRRGRTALDLLEELKLGVLSGTLDAGVLGRLNTAAATLADTSGDPRLDALMAEIELRAAVELAKFARR